MKYGRLLSYLFSKLMEQKPSKPNEIWVTDLCYCTTKWWLRQKYPHVVSLVNLDSKIMVGRIFHEGIAKILEKDSFIVEVELREKFMGYEIVGRIDAYDPEEKVLYEFKTTREIPMRPYDCHVLQAKLYEWLMRRCKPEFKVDLIRIVYFHMNSGRIACFELAPEDSDKITDLDVKGMIEDIENDRVHPRWTWECGCCIYKQLGLCPHQTIRKTRNHDEEDDEDEW